MIPLVKGCTCGHVTSDNFIVIVTDTSRAASSVDRYRQATGPTGPRWHAHGSEQSMRGVHFAWYQQAKQLSQLYSSTDDY